MATVEFASVSSAALLQFLYSFHAYFCIALLVLDFGVKRYGGAEPPSIPLSWAVGPDAHCWPGRWLFGWYIRCTESTRSWWWEAGLSSSRSGC